MEWEIINDGNMLEIPGVIIAYIVFFIIGINIYLPNRKLNRIYKENKTKAQ